MSRQYSLSNFQNLIFLYYGFVESIIIALITVNKQKQWWHTTIITLGNYYPWLKGSSAHIQLFIGLESLKMTPSLVAVQ